MNGANNFFRAAKWIACLIAVLAFTACSTEESSKESAHEQETVKAPEPEKPKQKTYNKLGDTLVTKYFNITATDSKISKTAVDPDGNTIESKDGQTKFVIVDTEIVNTSNETQYMAADTFSTVDSRGLIFPLHPACYKDFINVDYGPGVARKGKLIFEVEINAKGINIGVNSRILTGLVEKKERMLYIDIGKYDGSQGTGL